jgi:hypothetical protein
MPAFHFAMDAPVGKQAYAPKLYGVSIDERTTTSFREHIFLRSIEGLFATPIFADGVVKFEGLMASQILDWCLS